MKTAIKKVALLAAACCGLGLASRGAAAHHSDSLYFVDSRPADGGAVKIEGKVSRVRWINPHSELFVDVPDESGTPARWAIETDSWNQLRTLGWKEDTVEVGDRVVVMVSMSKFHQTAGRLRDLLVHGATPGDDAHLYLEYVPDASKESGQSDAPLRLYEQSSACPGTIPFDPNRQLGKETLLCMALDAEALGTARDEFGKDVLILRGN